jgi:hypothetical protein
MGHVSAASLTLPATTGIFDVCGPVRRVNTPAILTISNNR